MRRFFEIFEMIRNSSAGVDGGNLNTRLGERSFPPDAKLDQCIARLFLTDLL